MWIKKVLKWTKNRLKGNNGGGGSWERDDKLIVVMVNGYNAFNEIYIKRVLEA